MKALCLGIGGGDTRGCRSLPEDVVVVLLFVSRLRVKTFVQLDLAVATLCAVFPLEDVAVELMCVRM